MAGCLRPRVIFTAAPRRAAEAGMADTVVVTHTPFDQTAIRLVCAKYEIELPEITWLDTARVVRRTWLDLARKGYGLAPVAERLGIEFQHHNAAEKRPASECAIEV